MNAIDQSSLKPTALHHVAPINQFV